jgi:hypothetical protein
MMSFRLIAAAALSIALATPAMAMHRDYHHHTSYIHREHARLGYGSYAYDRGHDFVPANANADFDRRNTFN